MKLLFAFIFRRKPKKEEEIIKTTDKIIFHDLKDSSDEILTKLATHIINEEPVIVNIESLDIENANKAIAFIFAIIHWMHC